MKRFLQLMILLAAAGTTCKQATPSHTIVIQTDFGLKDGAVAEMKGIAKEVDNNLQLYDLTHEIKAYNIWEAAYRLNQVVPYWPKGTVFVSVIDPGVGTARKSVVVKTSDGKFVVTPDNGTLTLLAKSPGIEMIREIDETVNRRQGSEKSYTFHGRDVYMYTAARLASGKISFEGVGPELNRPVISFPYQQARLDNKQLSGNIPVLDIQYGNIWTNIPDSLVLLTGIKSGDSVDVKIILRDSVICSLSVPYVNSFGDVQERKVLAYINSLMNFSLAINRGNFAETFHVDAGPEWKIVILKRK